MPSFYAKQWRRLLSSFSPQIRCLVAEMAQAHKQALAELQVCAIVLRKTQPSTILNSLDIARAAVDAAIKDLSAVVTISENANATPPELP